MSDSLRPHGLCSLLGFSVHGILQARILEWVALPSPGHLPNPGSNADLPHCRQILYLLSHQGSREYWNGWPIRSSGDLPEAGIELQSPALQADSLPAELPGKPYSGLLLLLSRFSRVQLSATP